MKKKKLIILIVDDNKFFIDRMISLLEDTENIGYINVAYDYDEGFSSYMKERPDLVLLDINLPGRNGIELLKAINESGQPANIIMISNYDNEYYREQCRQLGARHFLDKSSDFAMVPTIIRQMATNE